jgi:hypothetical protein
MRKILHLSVFTVFVLCFWVLGYTLKAQTIPQTISFQGKLLESGTAVTGTRSMVFSFNGTAWTETHASVTVTNGLYSVVLGSVTPIPVTVFNNFTSATLHIVVNGTPLSPDVSITSAGFAFKAEKADDAAKIGGYSVNSALPGSGTYLKWSGTQWTASLLTEADGIIGNEVTNATASGGLLRSGTGTTVDPYTLGVSWGGTGSAITAARSDHAHSGDVTGSSSLTVTKLQGRTVSSVLPSSGQALKWNAGTTQWEPSADNNTTYTAGTGINITGTQITNTSPDQTVALTGGTGISTAGTYPNFSITNTLPNATHTGDVTGSNALTVVKLQGRDLLNTAPASGQTIKWNGTAWAPATDNSMPSGITNYTLRYDGSNWAMSSLLQNDANGIGIATPPVAHNQLYLYRPANDTGAGYTNINAYRYGAPSTPNGGGTSFGQDGVDAAIKGYSFWGNKYSAGVAGYNYLDYPLSGGVIGSDYSASVFGALAYKDETSDNWAGYFKGKVNITGQIRIQGGTPGAGKILTSDANGLATWGIAPLSTQWTTSGSDIYYSTGNVGIGDATPESPLKVSSAQSGITSSVALIENTYAGTNTWVYAIQGKVNSTSPNTGPGIGVLGMSASSTGGGCGLFGQSNGATGFGVKAVANSATGTNYGLYAATNSVDGYAGYFYGGKNYFMGNVGIGDLTPGSPLTVTSAQSTSQAAVAYVENTYSGTNGWVYGIMGKVNSTSVYTTPGMGVYGLSANTAGGGCGVFAQTNGATGYGVRAISASSTGENYGIYASTASADGYAGYFWGGKNYFMGNVGIGELAPTSKLQVQASGSLKSGYFLGNGTSLTNVTLMSENTSTGSGVAAYLKTYGTDATLVLGQQTGATGALIKGFGANGGNEEIRIDNDGTINLFNSSYIRTVMIDASESGTTDGSQITLYNTAGTSVIELDGDYGGTGSGRITTSELQITGGADIAEPFMVNDIEEIEPGTVLSIDPTNPGQLKIATKAYDRCVAGIVSGAGSVKPGLVLRQKDTEADGKHLVALTGRVYCLVDASAGAIEAGDLLTSSNTPGYAMKVTDQNKAFGAIIGKAMSKLEKGKGLVLVLVSLQ